MCAEVDTYGKPRFEYVCSNRGWYLKIIIDLIRCVQNAESPKIRWHYDMLLSKDNDMVIISITCAIETKGGQLVY